MADWQDLYYQVPDGLSLYARDYRGPDADAPVALLMHGLTRNSRDFQDLAPVLAKTHRVLVAEQRGRGSSAWDPQPARYQIPTYVGDMFALLSQLSLTRVAAVGTSMGGLMAMAMNAAQPGIFSHVVLNDIGPVLADDGLNRIKSYVGPSDGTFPDWSAAQAYNRQINGLAFPDYNDEDWSRFTRQLCVERDGQVALNYDANIAVAMRDDQSAAVPPDLWPLFDALKPCKTLLIRGALSDLLDVPTTVEMRRRHPDMAFIEVPNVGHAPMLNESGVAERIADFINDR